MVLYRYLLMYFIIYLYIIKSFIVSTYIRVFTRMYIYFVKKIVSQALDPQAQQILFLISRHLQILGGSQRHVRITAAERQIFSTKRLTAQLLLDANLLRDMYSRVDHHVTTCDVMVSWISLVMFTKGHQTARAPMGSVLQFVMTGNFNGPL